MDNQRAIFEKLMWMAVPLMFSAVTYMWTTLHSIRDQVIELQGKARLEAELAREKLRQDVLNYAAENRQRIALIEERMKKQ